MKILGIETSCDETAAAVVEDGKRLLSNVVLSSMDLHAAYGGVVPEIAARSHIESIIPVIEKALADAFSLENGGKRLEVRDNSPNSNLSTPSSTSDPWDQIDGIAVTYGAGLGGSLLVGVMTARTLAITKNKPLYAVNHVESHIYANFLTETSPSLSTSYQLPTTNPKFPMLGLIVSGGHSQIVLWRDHFDYTLLGQTRDDAIGEAFDKVAKIIGLPYPGGPSISEYAKKGDPHKFKFPKAKVNSVSPALEKLRNEMQATSTLRHNSNGRSFASGRTGVAQGAGYDYSFSGVKTAVLRAAQELIGEDHHFPSHKLSERLSDTQKADIAASFQRIAVETVVDKLVEAFDEFQPKSVVIGGGVAANTELRRQLADRLPLPIEYTDMKLCTDNGAMIATLGCYKVALNQPAADPFTLDIAPNLSM
ncbi:MAG: tRNA (adenosine(37)-N6)-threonylcarbamoyltransferase complex transferase subunit TsaD [Candidatus Saccharibacteria bacterium]|nr:tRNA (adenosine(37)-N6)-threonylcarbamoyltransferase complex transferase subunit TsaD [Candidatus Saccharibacteria bacterium]